MATVDDILMGVFLPIAIVDMRDDLEKDDCITVRMAKEFRIMKFAIRGGNSLEEIEATLELAIDVF